MSCMGGGMWFDCLGGGLTAYCPRLIEFVEVAFVPLLALSFAFLHDLFHDK